MWIQCKNCHQMMKSKNSSHECPEEILIRRELEIEDIINENLEYLDLEIDYFWDTPDAKFTQYMIDRGIL